MKKIKGIADASQVSGSTALCTVRLDLGINAEKLLDYNELKGSRLLIAVDDDIDIGDARQIIWAIATRSQPVEAVNLKNNRMVIDARKGENWTATRATLPFNK